MKIIIETIPHKEQRYNTVGDWIFDEKGNLLIRVSDMGDWKKELLVAMHEVIEVSLCKDRGITQKEVDAFDKKFEALRKTHYEVIGDSEPGNMESAPYHKEHVFATTVEKMLAQELDVNWQKYDKIVNSL